MKRVLISPEIAVLIRELNQFPHNPFRFEQPDTERENLIYKILNLLPTSMKGFKYEGKLYLKPVILEEIPNLEDFIIHEPKKDNKKIS
jgi:hypothetical protein